MDCRQVVLCLTSTDLIERRLAAETEGRTNPEIMRKLYFLTCLLLPAGVFATPLNYNVNYALTANSDVITFTLPQNPIPLGSCAFSTNCFSVTPVNLVIDGDAVSNGTVSFYESANQGGMTILGGDTLLVNNDGPGNLQLFSGTLSAPVLTAFSNLQLVQEPYGSPAMNEAFVLNASAPEPRTVYLLFPALLVSAALAGTRGFLARKSSGDSKESV